MNIQHFPVLRLHSAQIQPVPLQIDDDNDGDDDNALVGPHPDTRAAKITVHTALPTSEECSRHIYRDRMTEKHHMSITTLLYLAFLCCISKRMSHCLWWRLTNINHWCMDNLDKGPDVNS